MVTLTISMHFQQFEDLKFLIFFQESMHQDPQKPSQGVQASRIRWDCLNFTWES